MARFGLLGLRSARAIAQSHFKGDRARALFAGLGAHSFLPLESPVSASFGLVLGVAGARRGLAHSARRRAVHRGCARGLPGESRRHGYHQRAGALASGPGQSDLTLLDVTPRQLLNLGGRRDSAVLSPAAAALPLRPRRLQSGLGPEPADSMACHENACAPARSIWAVPLRRLLLRSGSRGAER